MKQSPTGAQQPPVGDSYPHVERRPGMELRRTLGLFDVALFFVVACSNLQWVATAAASGPSAVAVWIIGGLAMFAPLSIAVVFLSSHHPDEGGLYVWSKRAFGPFAGFLTGWTYWASTLPYFPALLYFAAGNAAFAAGSHAGALTRTPLYFIAFALAGLALATVVNVYGLADRKMVEQRRRRRALDDNAAAHRARRGGAVAIRLGDADHGANDPAGGAAEGPDLLVGDRVRVDRPRGGVVHGRRGQQAAP